MVEVPLDFRALRVFPEPAGVVDEHRALVLEAGDVLGEAPAVGQGGVAAAEDALLVRLAEVVGADAERLAEPFEDEDEQLRALVRGETEQDGGGPGAEVFGGRAEGVLVGDDVLDPLVADFQDVEALEVGVVVAPAAAEVVEEPVAEHEPQRGAGVLAKAALEAGVLEVFGEDGRIVRVEAELAVDGGGDVGGGDAGRVRRVLEGEEQAGPEKGEEDELVEVARLEGGVLAVVGESEELADVGLAGAGLFVEEDGEGGERDDGRGGGAAFAGEADEADEVLALSGVDGAAFRAEAVLAGEEPVRGAGARLGGKRAGGVDGDGDGDASGGGLLHLPGFALVVEPVGRYEIFRKRVSHDGRADLRKGLDRDEIAELALGFRVFVAHRDVLDVPGRDEHPLLPHGDVFRSAGAAEVGREEKDALLGLVGGEALGVELDGAAAGRLERREDGPGAADELVELEGERSAAVLPDGELLRRGKAGEESADGGGGGVFGDAGVAGERRGGVFEGHGRGADEAAGTALGRDAESVFDPHGHRVLAEGVEVGPGPRAGGDARREGGLDRLDGKRRIGGVLQGLLHDR